MGIAGSLLFIAVGAVLAFAVQIDSVGVLNINMIGWILLVIGLVALGLQFVSWRPRRPTLSPRVPPEEEEERGPRFRDAGPPP
ncbi:hypothetical protein NI17_004900 [Thermobifida halotolerans]|uniref:Uncharacterized protein n=1 Tax=Thermobifida halotolerans TaxID=483545 RepID=A0A399G6J1_9ACTN|nr:DUF6458 family protein [Thermobifida halotolerans]UOE20561.1 hypothetical protein NI17_004900 [Thermobifida halotolerans]